MNLGIWKLVQFAYKVVLRPLLVKAIDDPDSEWDDRVLKAMDGFFGYEE